MADGDKIVIDIPERSIELLVSEDVLAKRKECWVRPEKEVLSGYLNTYRNVSKSAAQGAIVE